MSNVSLPDENHHHTTKAIITKSAKRDLKNRALQIQKTKTMNGISNNNSQNIPK